MRGPCWPSSYPIPPTRGGLSLIFSISCDNKRQMSIILVVKGHACVETLVLDSNLAYIVVLVGMWLAVTAVYMPGTGVFEFIALVILVGGLVLLLSMPTNWLALLVLIVGVLSFILIPFFSMQHAPLAIVGLAMQGVGGMFLFEGQMLSPIVLASTLAISLAYHQFVLMPTLHRLQTVSEQSIEREDRVIGMRGRVTKTIDPVGTVLVDSELWSATSSEPLAEGTPIVVTGREGLSLIVEPLKRKHESEA